MSEDNNQNLAGAGEPGQSGDELAQCQKEKKEYLEGWQRAKADLLNYKKDEGKRFESFMEFAMASLVQEILPVLDSFDLSLGHLTPEAEKGVLLIRYQLEDVLKKSGLEQIKIEIGEVLNPEKHEAVGETESEKPTGTIAEITQKGYLFRGRVLRPVRVKISKGKTN